MRTRFALILFLRMVAHKAACHTLINEDMVQILLVLEVLFTQDSKVEDLFCGASSGYEPSLFFSNYFFSLGFKPLSSKSCFLKYQNLPFLRCHALICIYSRFASEKSLAS